MSGKAGVIAKKDIVLDLAGHTLAYEVNDGFCAVQVREGNFTLNDSVGGGKITASDSAYVVFTYGSSDEYGDITINGGTLQNLREDITEQSQALNIGDDEIKLTINGGTFIGGSGVVQTRCPVTINNGVFTATEKTNAALVCLRNSVINNGYFNGDVYFSDSYTHNVTGGYYSSRPLKTAEGYAAVPTNDEDAQSGIDTDTYKYKVVDKANLKNYKITIVFNIESDKLPSEPIEKAEGEELGYIVVPFTLKAADGKFYAFDGWYWDENYENPITKDPVITKDMTIYGLYEVIETCTVTVDYNGHGGNEVRKITGVPKGTFADYPVLLALAGAEKFSWEAYEAVEDLIYERGLEAIAPTEDGYALIVYLEQYNNEFVAYGLKKTYDSWDDFHDEFDERVNVFEDTTFYLQWSKIVDSVEIVCSEPLVCGAEKGTYIDCLSAGKDSGCTLEVTDESGNFNDNKYVGGYNYGYEAEINANYGYVLDKNAAAWSADVMIDGLIFMGPISPINPDTGSYPYTSAIETYFYVRCEHKWGEPQDVSAEEAAHAPDR